MKRYLIILFLLVLTVAATAQVTDVVTSGGGVLPAAKLGSGTANGTTFLRGDGTWAAPAGSGDAVLAAGTEGAPQTWGGYNAFANPLKVTSGSDYISLLHNGLTFYNDAQVVTSTWTWNHTNDIWTMSSGLAVGGLKIGTTSTAGYVWKATDTSGNGGWAVDATGGTPAWGSVTGTLSNQTDLQDALNLKANLAGPTFTGTTTVAALKIGDASTDGYVWTATDASGNGAWEVLPAGGLVAGGNLTNSVATGHLYSFIPNAYHATANTYASLFAGSNNTSNNQIGIRGLSYAGYGVSGESTGSTGAGVYGKSNGSGPGMSGTSSAGYGVQGETTTGGGGIYGISYSGSGPAVKGYQSGNSPGLIINQVHATADIAHFQDGGTVVASILQAGVGNFTAGIGGGGIINVKAYGAKGDGTTDDYAAIVAAIAALETQGGNGTLLFPKGTYIINRCIGGTGTGEPAAGTQADLTINGISNFKVSGYGAKIKVAGNFTRVQGTKEPLSAIRFESCSDFSVEGIEVDGSVGDMSQSAGTSHGSSEPAWSNVANTPTMAWVVDNTVIHWMNTGVAAGAEPAWAAATSYSVGATIAENGVVWKAVSTMAEPATGHGIYAKACVRYTIRDVYLHHSAADGIYIGGSSSIIDRDIVIQNARCWFNARQGLTLANAQGVLVSGGSYNYTGFTGGTDTVATDNDTATPGQPAIDATYGMHSPSAGIDIEPTVATLTDGNKPGNMTFVGVTMKENLGSQFMAGSHAETENVVVDSCVMDQGPNINFRNTLKLYIPNITVQNSYINCETVLAGFSSGTNISVTLRGNRILSDYQGVTVITGGNSRVIVENNRIEGTHTTTASYFLPRIDDTKAIFRDNIIVIPSAALSGANKNISVVKNCISESNRWETPLAAGSYHFYTDYTGATVRGDTYASAYIRPALNSTWPALSAFSQGTTARVGGLSATLAAYDFGSITGNTTLTTTVTVTGAVVGDFVLLSGSSAFETTAQFTAFVSAADTVTIVAHAANATTAVDPASRDYYVQVLKR